MQWTAPFGGRDIAVTTDGFAYVTGFSETDLSTVKLNPNGSNEWARLKDVYGLNDVSQRIALDAQGDAIVLGSSEWQCAPRGGPCYKNLAFVRYAPNGDLVCTTNESLLGPILPSLAIFSMKVVNNSVYFCSILQESYTFLTVELGACGDFRWTQGFGIGGGSAASLAVNSLGESYVAGGTFTNFPNVSYVIFKVDPNGNEVWRRYYSNGSLSGFHRADAMTLDAAGNIYVTGQSGESPETVDWATLKYSPDGTQQWVRRYDGPAHAADQARAIAVDSTGNVYVAGTQTTTNGSTEIVLIKYVDLTSIVLQQDGGVLLRFLAAAGQSCRFQASSDLATWSDIGSGIADTNGVATFVDPNVGVTTTRFYRMVSP